jgi:pilus assembly protein CpaE
VTQLIYNSGIFSVALITVSVDLPMADEIADCVSRISWAVQRADCEGYISAVKRPPFPQTVKAAHAAIAVIDFDKDIEQALVAAAYVQELFSGNAAVIALSASQDPDVLLRAMRAGCAEFIGPDFDDATLTDTMNRLHQKWSAKSVRPTARGSVLTFFGAKGGVGTTTLAVHLAMYLVQCHQKKTLLIDNHPQLGHACIYLGIDGSRNHFQEVVRNLSRLDSDLLKGYIATHSSGLEVLASPDICGDQKQAEPEAIAQTLDFLRGEYDYIIIDSPTALNDTSFTIIDASNQVYLVASPEIGAIRDLSRYVDSLTQSEHHVEKVKIVINRSSAQHAVSVEQIEKAIRLPVSIKLPNSYAELARSTLLGEPISHKQKTEFSLPILKWANGLVGATAHVDEDAAPKKSRFALWK